MNRLRIKALVKRREQSIPEQQTKRSSLERGSVVVFAARRAIVTARRAIVTARRAIVTARRAIVTARRAIVTAPESTVQSSACASNETAQPNGRAQQSLSKVGLRSWP
jgi:hypothetical protein